MGVRRRRHAGSVWRYEEARWNDVVDDVAVEEPQQIQVAGRDLAVIMRTPGHDRYLAAGFLFSEGIIAPFRNLADFVLGLDRDGFPQPNVLDVRLSESAANGEPVAPRGFPVSSSCGLCGATSVDSVMRRVQPVPLGGTVAPTEDVGRHNAVDKLIGEMLLERRFPLGEYVLLVSGRASFELLQKTAVAGISIFVAVGAPSSLAIELAQAAQVTLIGLLRDHRFVVYAWPERLTSE